jgi:hypothetical protein
MESPAFPFIGSRGGKGAGGALEVKFCRVLREWSAIPGHHGDVEDKTVKRLWILWHASLDSLFDRQLVEAGSRWVDGEWIRPSPGNFGV